MAKRKTFNPGDKVIVKDPAFRTFIGEVLSEYHSPPFERRIYVDDGTGIERGFLVRYVHHTRPATKKKGNRKMDNCELCGRWLDSNTVPSYAPREERDDNLCSRCERMQKEHPAIFEFVTDVVKFNVKKKSEERDN